jgi:peptidoglycan hydrolase-like protein with peptidoglycan-binding domain
MPILRRDRSGRRRLALSAAVAALLLAAGAPALADYDDGQAAFDRREYRSALVELEPLAEQGDGRAQRLVGLIYRDGLGVPRDLVLAYAWLHVAAGNGEPQAASARDEMSWRLSPSEIDEGMRLARDWRPGAAMGGQRAPRRTYDVGSYKPSIAGYDTGSRALDRTEAMDLQWHLAVRGYDPGPADGVVGPRTRAAIQQYQMDAGLPADGRATMALLDHLQFTDPPVRNTRVVGNAPRYPQGSSGGGPEYEDLPPIEENGDTAGMDWPEAEAEARGAVPPAPTGNELHGIYVMTIERELEMRGYDPGPVDGFLDRQTQQAIRRYQADYGLPATGEIGLELVNHLRIITAGGGSAI